MSESQCPKCGADSKGALEYKCGTKHGPKGTVYLHSDLCRAISAERDVEMLKQHVADLELHVSSDGVRLGLVDSLRDKRRKVADLTRQLAERDALLREVRNCCFPEDSQSELCRAIEAAIHPRRPEGVSDE